MTVSVAITPKLQSDHQLELMMDGQKVAGPSSSTSLTAKEVWRGAHSFSVQVVDRRGKQIGQSNSVTVHVHQNSAK